MFNWENRESIGDGVWVLKDFLTPEAFAGIKKEIRTTPAEWHTRYHNRIISENGDYPLCHQLGGRLLPHLHDLFNETYNLSTARAYLDLSGCRIFPHFDSKEFAVNVQIYLSDIEYPELGTQFCFNTEINERAERAELNEQEFMKSLGRSPESEFKTIPFKPNWGYINYNNPRKIHRTRIVPAGAIRESLHLNFRKSDGINQGLELNWK
jgi:hypothetical protein